MTNNTDVSFSCLLFSCLITLHVKKNHYRESSEMNIGRDVTEIRKLHEVQQSAYCVYIPMRAVHHFKIILRPLHLRLSIRTFSILI